MLVGTPTYNSSALPDVPVVANNVVDLAAVLTDPTLGGFDDAHCAVTPPDVGLAEIGEMLSQAADEAQDLLMFYYSGHGLLDPRRGELYLSLAGTRPDLLAFTALAVEAVCDALRDSQALSRVLILDSCYSGRATGHPLTMTDEAILGQLDAAGTYTLTSASANQTALILPGEEHTAFTERMLALLRTGSPSAGSHLTLGDIYRHLYAQMKAEGLPRPQQRGTELADLLGLVRNRGFQDPQGSARAPSTMPDPGDARQLHDVARVARLEQELDEVRIQLEAHDLRDLLTQAAPLRPYGGISKLLNKTYPELRARRPPSPKPPVGINMRELMLPGRTAGRAARISVTEQSPLGTEANSRHSSRQAVRWSFLNTTVIRVGNFATGVILARGLLGPRDWGLYAVGLTALAVLLSANELGVSLAIVRWRDDKPEKFAPTVLTLSTASSSLFYLLLFFAAPDFGRLLGAADATSMLRVLGVAVIIDGIACVPAGILTRNFMQRTRAMIDVSNFLVSSSLTIGMAVAGFGAMSFAWGSIIGNMVALIGCALAAPGYLKPGWNRQQARRLLAFGLPLAGASLLVLAMLNVDSVVVGATLGPAQLGLYQIAFNISSWPVRTVSEIARRVTFASFSLVADSPAKLSESFGRGLALLMAAAVPACVLLAVLSKPIIFAVYGQRWGDAAGALRFLVLFSLLRVAFELAYDCLVTTGRRIALITVQSWWLVALIPVLILFARGRGITGVGIGHILVAASLVAPLFLWALSRATISPKVIVKACTRPFFGGVLMAAAALALGRLGLNPIEYTLLGTAVGFAVYIPTVWPLRHIADAKPAQA